MPTRKSSDGLYLRGPTWWLNFQHEGKRYQERLGRLISKTTAKEIAQVKRSEILKGGAGIKRKRKSLTFDEGAKLFIQWSETNRKPSSVHFHKETLRRLGETFSGKRLDEISRFSVERYKSARAKKAPVRVNREIATLKSMFYRLIEWNKFNGPNPAVGVKFLPEPKTKIRYLEHDEEERLVAAASSPLRELILVGIHTGLRVRAEALTLTWGAIDLAKRAVTVEAAYAKNGECRTVPLNDAVHTALAELKKRSASTDPGDPVFTWNGITPNSINTTFRTARGRAELGNDVTPHTLRHTFASRLVMAGVDLRTVQELGGWKHIEMVMRYAHLSDEHRVQAVDKLMRASIPTPLKKAR